MDNLLGNETIEWTLLEEQLRPSSTQDGNAQGASTKCIKLMEPKCFKDKLRFIILQWLYCMESYLITGQVAEDRAARGPILAISCQYCLRLLGKITVCGRISTNIDLGL